MLFRSSGSLTDSKVRVHQTDYSQASSIANLASLLVRAVRLILLSALACCAPAPPPAPIAIAINVAAHPIPLDPTDPAKIQVGRLRFLGGLHLQSGDRRFGGISGLRRSEEHTSELQSLMRISYAVFCLKKKKITLTMII